jgi:hypothetical protein
MTNEKAEELIIKTIINFIEDDEVCKYKVCSDCGFERICADIVDYVGCLDD